MAEAVPAPYRHRLPWIDMARRIVAIVQVVALLTANAAATAPLCRLGLRRSAVSEACCCAAGRAEVGRRSCCGRKLAEDAPAGALADGLRPARCQCQALADLPATKAKETQRLADPRPEADHLAMAVPAVHAWPASAPEGARCAHDTGPPARVRLCTWRI
jgi:hypothetical protein